MIKEDVSKILACPACKGELEFSEDTAVCRRCAKKYPIREGIPVLLVEEAQ